MQLEVAAQPLGGVQAMAGEHLVAAAARHRAETGQHVEQEEAEPDALALPTFADAVHAVVPVAGGDQRQAARAEQVQAALQRAHAMLIQALVQHRACRQIVIRLLIGVDRAAFDIRHRLVEHTGIAGGVDVAAQGQRQP